MHSTEKLAAALIVDAPAAADIAALRARLAITQAELARAAGVHVNTLARAERAELELGAAAWSLALLALGEHPAAVATLRRARPAAAAPAVSTRAKTYRDLAAGGPKTLSRPRR